MNAVQRRFTEAPIRILTWGDDEDMAGSGGDKKSVKQEKYTREVGHLSARSRCLRLTVGLLPQDRMGRASCLAC